MSNTFSLQNPGFRMVLLPALVLFFASTLIGQSLADLARQERARKGQIDSAGRVFTNDDIPGASSRPAPVSSPAPTDSAASGVKEVQEGTPSDAGTTASGMEKGPTTPGDKPDAKPAKSPEEIRAALEKEYRDKFAKLREAQAYEEKKLDVIQREMNLMQTQYYSDPNVALREQTFRGQINERTQEIEQQKATVEKAKQSISNLEDELRKKNLPPGWAR